ncbi:MAG: hypothetical protein A3B68_05875 [Candidatus Melainabacteria bacterium RIFCSPHIGHO2_02_FULL_34_12]|nr:MAG: hypothetical protein A3B68_05875 [Candidatus Melainabacteria bacterium RIFCSPHIGHO2_02_FULL_34_12]
MKLALPAVKVNVNVQVSNNKLLTTEVINQYVLKYINNHNILFLSPRVLSRQIINDFPLVENVIIRKYFFPSPRIYVSLIEKQIWAIVYSTNNVQMDKNPKYVTLDGELINNINMEEHLITVFRIHADDINALTTEQVNKIKEFLDILDRKMKKVINYIHINVDSEITFVLNNESKVYLGYIDNDLKSQKAKLDSAIKLLLEREINPKYVDLSPESHVVIKPDPDNTNGKSNLFKKIFKKSKSSE